MVQPLHQVCIAIAVALTPSAVASTAIFGNSFGRYVVNFMKESERAETCVTQFLIGRKAPSDCQGEIAQVRYLAEVKSVPHQTEEDRMALAEEIIRTLVSDAKH